MPMTQSRSLTVAAAVLSVAVLSGCAATQVAISKRDLDVQTKMSATIFLDPVKQHQRTVFVQIRNTSDKPDLDVRSEVVEAISARGFTVVDDPDQAHFMLQANVLQVGKSSAGANEQAFAGGFGSALNAGVLASGTAYALGNSSSRGLAGLAILGVVADTVAGAAVKDVYFSMITDVQIRERMAGGGSAAVSSQHQLVQGTSGTTTVAYAEQSEWRTYQTRVMSTANQVNLEFENALPELKAGLTRSLAGLF